MVVFGPNEGRGALNTSQALLSSFDAENGGGGGLTPSLSGVGGGTCRGGCLEPHSSLLWCDVAVCGGWVGGWEVTWWGIDVALWTLCPPCHHHEWYGGPGGVVMCATSMRPF